MTDHTFRRTCCMALSPMLFSATVGGEPGVVEVLKVELGRLDDDHAAPPEQRHLLGVEDGRLGEGALHAEQPTKK